MSSEIQSTWATRSRTTTSFRIEPSDRARLGWWVLLAVLLSILVHIFLVIAFDIIKVKQWTPNLDFAREMNVFKSSRVTISKSTLEEILPVPVAAPEEAPAPEEAKPLIDESLNEFEMQELLSDLEVKLTPEVTEATRILAEDAPPIETTPVAPAGSEVAAAELPEPVKVDTTSLKSQLLEATRASESQPLLELNLGPTAPNRDDLLKSGGETGKKGKPEGEVVDGFSNLGQLLTMTGPLGDNTKPILMPTDLLFEYDSSTLRENAKLSLMRLGILIQRNPDSEFVIEGHSDTRGTVEYNQVLSERRAYAVRDWLLHSLRIDADNIRAVGRGKSRPLANPNGTIEEQALNRRVEIIINKRTVRKTRA